MTLIITGFLLAAICIVAALRKRDKTLFVFSVLIMAINVGAIIDKFICNWI